jgi:hypothetical protein
MVLADEVRPELTQFVREGEGFTPVSADVSISERPPILTVASYPRRVGNAPA